MSKRWVVSLASSSLLSISSFSIGAAHAAPPSTPGAAPSTTGSPAPSQPSSPPSAQAPSGSTTSDATTATATATTTDAAPASAPDESAALLERARRAMLQFNVGAIDEAYAELCRVVLECDERGDAVCDPKREASFYRDVGVVLAAGKKQHDAGVQAFKKAISLDPLVSIPQEYRSEKVNRAFAEALYGPQRQIAPTFDIEPQRPSAQDPNASTTQAGPRKNGFFLVEAIGKLGVMGEVRSNCDVVDCNDSAAGVSTLGVAGTIGGTPTNGPFALAGRARVGAYYWRGSGSPAGYFGTAALAGAIFGKRTDRRFAYVLGGPGFETHPATGEFLFTAHALGGVSLNGFDIGGGLDLVAGELSAPFPSPSFDRNYSYMVLFGVHVGYAGLF